MEMRKLVAVLSLVLSQGVATADPCRSVEVTFKPVGSLQLAVWIEDTQGNYVDTAYITRLTGTFGLANRPGAHFLKSEVRFPYGRRDMVLPVWAHKRNKAYGLVVMGGAAGNSPARCQAGGIPASECDDRTIAYHSYVSSPEPFYCSPSGGVVTQVNGVDVVTCASAFTGSKGAFADAPMVSLYPPRADLTNFIKGYDSSDANMFATVNDLTAVSGATPAASQVIAPIYWAAPADGQYVLKVEASLEKDFNTFHTHKAQDDTNLQWNNYGKEFLGQPSVVYSVPFTVGDQVNIATATAYAGYGDWDGATGALHAPDNTINTNPGSGAGRLLDHSDDQGTWRVKVVSNPTCMVNPMPDAGMPTDGGVIPPCMPPGSPTGLALTPHASAIDVKFASAAGGVPTARFDVRYSYDAITDDSFLRAIPSSTAPPPPGAQGSTVSTMISGLKPEQSYVVAVRALASCGAASPVATKEMKTSAAKFVTLEGCFIATAAYGTPLAAQLDVLRRFRDRTLLASPLGRIAVAAYYALSPPLAAAISTDDRLRAAARALVEPIVRVTRAAQR
jgi:hypothetical protein